MHIRPLRPADAEPAFQLRVAAFSDAVHADYDTAEIYIPDEHRLVAVDGGQVIGHLGVWPFRQAFLGSAVPMGGVGGVVVADSRRGSGVGSRLIAAGLAHIADAGMPVATLYPSTPVPYRRYGWEYAGVRLRRTMITRDLLAVPAPGTTVGLRPCEPADLAAVAAVHDAVTVTEQGGLVTGDRWLRRALQHDPDEAQVALVAVRDDRVDGLLLLAKAAPADEHSSYTVDVRRLFGADGDVERALWRAVGHHHTVAARTMYVSRPADPLLFELRHGLDVSGPATGHFMSRLVDAPAAVAARGWPPVAAAVELDVVDPHRPAHAGRHVLEVRDRRGALTSGGRGRVTVDIGALSSLYTGFVTPAHLAHAGRLPGATTDDLVALTDAFASPAPFMRDVF